MRGAQAADAVRVRFDPVARADLDVARRAEVGFGHCRAEFVEEVLEAAGRDDLEDPAGAVARVSERVPLLARLEHEVSGVGVDHVVAELRGFLRGAAGS